jgi:hypothetical protein
VKTVEKKTRVSFENIYRAYMIVVSLVSLIVAGLFATQVISVSVHPEIEIPDVEVDVPDVNVDIPENLTKRWTQSYRGDALEDWLGPFFLTGDRALISWSPAEGTALPDAEAQLYHAVNRSSINLFITVGVPTEFSLGNGGNLTQGWYYIYHGLMTGTNKTVEVYLYG